MGFPRALDARKRELPTLGLCMQCNQALGRLGRRIETITGDARWASKTIVWFVMIKADKNRYPNNPLWGDGWVWALFKADAPDKQVATSSQRTAWAVMFQLSQPTGYTYKVTQSSNRSKQKTLQRLVSENASRGELRCATIC